MLNEHMYLHGSAVFISHIGPQPEDQSDPGSTLVCVTKNFNTSCSRSDDSNGMTNDRAGAVGEWHYPNGEVVPHSKDNVVDFARVCYTYQSRLSRQVSCLPPPGVYTCVVSDAISDVLYNTSIILQLGNYFT